MSKALEAAAEKLAEWADDRRYSVLNKQGKDIYRHGASQIIRAFADNVTEEMAAKCNGEIETICFAEERNCEHPWKASPENIRAAMLEGLK